MRKAAFCIVLLAWNSSVFADDFSGTFVGAGVGAVHSSGSGTVSRETRAGTLLLDHASSHAEPSETSEMYEIAALHQWRWGSQIVLGIEGAYQFRDLDLESKGDIFSPGAKAVSHIGDRGMIRSRVGLEVLPGLLTYSAVGVSYAWENEAYVQLANGLRTSQEDTSTFNLVLGGGIEYAIGDVIFDLRYTAVPGKSDHSITTVPGPLGTTTSFESTTSSGWTYDLGLRVMYRLGN